MSVDITVHLLANIPFCMGWTQLSFSHRAGMFGTPFGDDNRSVRSVGVRSRHTRPAGEARSRS